MSFSLKITSFASKDEEEAYNHYEDKQTGLGEAFLDELHKKYVALSIHPDYYSYINGVKY